MTTTRCPFAIWRPWQYPQPGTDKPTYYRALNNPEAVVLHSGQGYVGTWLAWADQGFYPKSWHYSVKLDGTIYQHLDHADGGYHAGITDAHARAHPPTWPLWKGTGINVNHYTIGIEAEGFSFQSDGPLAYERPKQVAAIRKLCHWLSETLGIPYERVHFPAHAEIDIVNRAYDFAAPSRREMFYRYMFQEDTMTPEDVRALIEEYMRTHPPIDERLRDVEQKRFEILNIASGPVDIMEDAHAELDEAGFFDGSD